ACHQLIRVIDCIDFLHRHIELKSQFIQVPPRVMNLPTWNQHGAIAFSRGGTNFIRYAADRADLSSGFDGSSQGNASLNGFPLEQGDESYGHGRSGAWSVAAGWSIGDSFHGNSSTML